MATVSTASDGPSRSRAAVYTRVSTDDQAAEGHSLGEQERRALELIAREGWEYADTYEDAGVSGAAASRPALDRLLSDVAAGAVDVVIVFALDRLGRDAGILRDLLRVLDAAGVRVVAAGRELDRETPEGRLQTGILAEFAEFERAKIRDRARAGIHGRTLGGKPWGPPAYGYARRDDGHWTVEPREAAIVRRIFADYVERGLAFSQIARTLTREGVPSRNGRDWTPSVVSRIVNGRHVLGSYKHGGDWLPGQHPPLIDQATWDTAQTLAAQGQKYAPRGGGRLPKRHLLVRGTLRCVCGAAMLPRSDGDVYVCRRRKVTHGVDGCAVPPLKRAAVEMPLLSMFEEFALDVEGTKERLSCTLDERLEGVRVEEARAGREVAEKRAQIDRVESDYLAGRLGAASYERLADRLGDELAAAQAERQRLEEHAAAVTRFASSIDTEHDVLRRLAELRAEVARHVAGAVDASAASGDIGALRAAIGAVFARVDLESAANEFAAGVGAVADAGLWLLPQLRADVVRDWRKWSDGTESAFENVERVPLGLPSHNLASSGVFE